MTGDPSEFKSLLRDVQAGDQESARRLYDLYHCHVLRVVRRKLHHRLRSQFDSADLLQSVWASFFAIPAERHVFTTAEELIDFLSAVAANKTTELFRKKMQTHKRDLNREEQLEDAAAPAAVQPTPSQIVLADELWKKMRLGRSPDVRELLDLRRDGHTVKEIAARMGVHPKTIQRHLRRVARAN